MCRPFSLLLKTKVTLFLMICSTLLTRRFAHQLSAPPQESLVDYQPTISPRHPDPPVSEYGLEEEAGEYMNSVHVEAAEPVQEYSYEEHLQQDSEPELESELEPEPEQELKHEANRLEEETHFEETSHVLQNSLTSVHEPQFSVEEPTGKPEKFTYASILRTKGRSQPPVISQQAFAPRPPVSEWNHISQSPVQQPIPPPPSNGVDSTEESLSAQEGEPKSVYVRNLPSSVTNLDLQQEFESFGRIKHDGIFLRNRADTGVCYAFVEFEDIQSVWNALKASPIQLGGRKVYIEERRPNSGPARGGRTGGRGRGGRGGRNYGR